jgi:hypothetical protein
MWKKALWVYAWLYVLVMAGGIIYQAVMDIINKEFMIVAVIFPLLMFLPAWVVISGIKGKRVFVLWTIISLLMMLFLEVAIVEKNFLTLGLAEFGKALLFVPMILGLVYYGFVKRPPKKQVVQEESPVSV